MKVAESVPSNPIDWALFFVLMTFAIGTLMGLFGLKGMIDEQAERIGRLESCE